MFNLTSNSSTLSPSTAHTSISPFKKTKSLLLTLMVTSALAACSPQGSETEQNSATDTETAAETAQTQNNDNAQASIQANNARVTIDSVRGDVELPANPSPVVVYDMTLLQDLAALGITVDGAPSNLYLDNLKAAVSSDSPDVGTVFEPNLEALSALQPQAILIGSRMAPKFEELNKMAPTADMTLAADQTYEMGKQRLADLGKLFNKSEQAAKLQQEVDDAIAKAKEASAGKGNGLVISVAGNKISAAGEGSRLGFVHRVFGIPAADTTIEDSKHGQPVSFEYLQKVDPDWLFVLDRSAAIGQEGLAAKEVLDNPLLHQTKAWKNNHIVYLSPDAYLAFGGYYQWMTDAKTVTEAMSKAPKVAAD
ncbi:siderophore ABC transporter substrate-binding protein [Psychrobacter sp. FDAARGOS_221]|uniref:siderophore ABC transporter substrate-binding protein n=1 Tax=Psychrobacter sp. FDAARGOS_221 TaxID=1975705 RepID=UPI000BB5892E|nr:siderophore ABC transporter substrate-binding protein [Psychrobacter sp. FDAARGOS_221]PNK60094.1 ABC transporter substrate-binding protein [Psychrobacter sp. FDAARGOS_221]